MEVLLDIRLFGTMEARLQDGSAVSFRSRKAQWLLAMLALRAGREVQRSFLASTLWPDSDEPTARSNLRQRLSNELRSSLGTASPALQSPTRDTLTLCADTTCVDVLKFDIAIRAGTDSSLAEAVVLYRGPLLEDCMEDWAIAERTAREHAMAAALERLGQMATERGAQTEAVGYLKRLIALDPLRESAYALLLRSLAQAGDSAAVKQIYRELRLVLRDEINSEPTPEMRRLYETLLAHQVSGLPARSASDETNSRAPIGRLPVPLTDLIGRERDIAAVCGWLQSRRLVTLTGCGGVGKTRLCIAVGRALERHYADGVWFVELAQITDGGLVSRTIAQALKIKEQHYEPIDMTLTRELRGRHALLIMDNCEQILDRIASTTELLLSECSEVRVIATSRQPLGITGEQIYRVPSLDIPSDEILAEKNPTALMDYPSVRLFVERAIQANPEFRLDRRRAADVTAICNRLDGIPLAIEMAAARLRSFSAGDVASRLDDRFKFLTSGSRTAMPRHQTLRALIDWSYDMLDEAEKALLARLSVFSGGWILQAVEAVCIGQPLGDTTILHVHASLVEKSLVVIQPRGSDVRYTLQETVREYARERLVERNEERRVSEQHLRYYVAFAEEASPHYAATDQQAWLDRADAEYGNFRLALRYAMDERLELGLRLGAALKQFWELRAHLSEGREQLRALLANPGGQKRSKLRADALLGLATLSIELGGFSESRACLEESLTISRECGDKKTEAAVLANLSFVIKHGGDYITARSLLLEGLAIRRELGDRGGEASILHGLGNIAVSHAEFTNARSLFECAMAINSDLGNHLARAANLNALSVVLRDCGDYNRARTLCGESLAISREMGNPNWIALSTEYLGLIALFEGNLDNSRSLLEQALGMHRRLGGRTGEANVLRALGATAHFRGEASLARSLCEQGLTIARELQHRFITAWVLADLARVYAAEGDCEAGMAAAQESVQLFRELGIKQGPPNALDAIALVAMSDNCVELAVRMWGAASALRDEAGSPLPTCEKLERDARLCAARTTLGDAAHYRAWEEGRAMSWESAVAYALGEPPIA